MARIRTVKPEFWKHEDLSELPAETHMLAAALLNYADDEGYFKAHPKLVQAECCPLREDSTSVRRSLELLSGIGYIRLFVGTDGKEYGHIVKFLEHQRVDRAKPSVIKDLESIGEESSNDRRSVAAGMEGNGREEEGKGEGAAAPPACPHQEIIELYHETLPALPRVKAWTDERQALLRSRWREDPKRQDLDWWRKFFGYVSQSDFLMGRAKGRGDAPPFMADLEWLIRPKNFVKVIEGKYENREAA